MSNTRTQRLHNTENTANRAASLLTAMADITNIGAIFFFKQFFPILLKETAQFILFPFAATATIIQALLGWDHVRINSGKDSSQIVRAIIATLTALAITAAVVIALGFSKSSLLGVSLEEAPALIFAATIGTNALIHFSTSAYYAIKAARIKPLIPANETLDGKPVYDDTNKLVARNMAIQQVKNNVLFGLLDSEVAATIVAVMIYEQTQLSAGLGGVAAVSGNTILLYQLYQLTTAKQQTQRHDIEADLPANTGLCGLVSCCRLFDNGYLRLPQAADRTGLDDDFVEIPRGDSLSI